MTIIEKVIYRMKQFEPPEGYYLAFSGGKDSQCIYHLAKEAGVKFDAHFNFTTVDPPELLRFIRENYPDVIWERPKKTMWELIIAHGVPPTSRMPYCCETLKEKGGIGRQVMTGLRWSESKERKKREMIAYCPTLGKTSFNPIIDWQEEDVWNYLNMRNIHHCSLYDNGYKRIGCVMCAKKTKKQRYIDSIRYPKYFKAYMNVFQKMLDKRIEKGLKVTWKTPEDVWTWWIRGYDKDMELKKQQTDLFCGESKGKEVT